MFRINMFFSTTVIMSSILLSMFIAPKLAESVEEPTEREFERASRESVNVDVNVSPALTENEMYRDLLHLTSANFTDIVLQSKDTWVIVFHDGNIYRTWKTMAISMRGVLWVGLVNKKEEVAILKLLKMDSGKVPPALVIPYNYFGNPKTRQEKAVQVDTPLEARKRAVSTMPDNTIKLDKDSIQDFLIESYVGKPSKFPTIFITYERETPALVKALTLRFGEYFHFGIMSDPSPEDLNALGLKDAYVDFPTLLILVTADLDKSNKEPELSAVFYDAQKMGEMNYPNVVQYLFQMNSRFRVTLPGDSMANDEKTATMSDILAIEKIRFKIIGSEGENKQKQEGKDEL